VRLPLARRAAAGYDVGDGDPRPRGPGSPGAPADRENTSRKEHLTMKRILWITAVVSLAFLQAGCKNKYEKVMDDQISLMEEMVDVLKDVKDEASAKAAVPKLEDLKKRGEEIEKRAEEVGEPPEDEQKALKEKYEEQMEEVMKEMFAQMSRLMADEKIRNALAGKLPMGFGGSEVPDVPDMPDLPDMPEPPGD
jgi:hypothetical protein